jgi:hypothetical protein
MTSPHSNNLLIESDHFGLSLLPLPLTAGGLTLNQVLVGSTPSGAAFFSMAGLGEYINYNRSL